MKKTVNIFLSIIFLSQLSCGRIKNKSKELVHKTTEKISERADDLEDKVIPKFDPETPDSKYNKKRFKDFLKVPVTEDVKNIYCSSDAIGIDASYQFAFNCSRTTADNIIKNLELKIDKSKESGGYGIHHDFNWWDLEKIKLLDLYSYNFENNYFRCFWYDELEQKGYFFDYDM